MIDKSGLRQHYLADKEGQDRLENLDELINAAPLPARGGDPSGDGDAVPDGGPLASFLAHASLEAGEHQAGEGEEAVQLMTVHAAKGLEFDVVFITGLEQGLFPHENAAQERDGLEEERRLMYVAVTRARHRLYLSHAQTRLLHGQTRYCLPSAFSRRTAGNAAAQDQPGSHRRHAGRERWLAATSRRRRSADWPERPPCPVRSSGSSCLPKAQGRKRAYRSISAPAA
jgi:superfamily I DNA/RNA helicase